MAGWTHETYPSPIAPLPDGGKLLSGSFVPDLYLSPSGDPPALHVTSVDGPDAAAALASLSRNPEPKSIVAFANEYGAIGTDSIEVAWVLPEPPEAGSYFPRAEVGQIHVKRAKRQANLPGEKIESIRRALAELNISIDLLTALTNDEPLDRFLDRDEGGRYRISVAVPFSLAWNPSELAAEPDRVLCQSEIGDRLIGQRDDSTEPSEIETVAWRLLKSVVNSWLKKNSALRWDSGYGAPGDWQRYIVFTSPLGCAWDSLANSVVKGAPPRRCPRCGTAFLQHPAIRRGHATYCSRSCQRHVLRKQRRAMELKESGCTVVEIASKLRTDVEYVRGWIDVVKDKESQRKKGRA